MYLNIFQSFIYYQVPRISRKTVFCVSWKVALDEDSHIKHSRSEITQRKCRQICCYIEFVEQNFHLNILSRILYGEYSIRFPSIKDISRQDIVLSQKIPGVEISALNEF
jgi:hypothetical protein